MSCERASQKFLNELCLSSIAPSMTELQLQTSWVYVYGKGRHAYLSAVTFALCAATGEGGSEDAASGRDGPRGEGVYEGGRDHDHTQPSLHCQAHRSHTGKAYDAGEGVDGGRGEAVRVGRVVRAGL